MGLVQDVAVLSKSGYTKTSAALDFVSQLHSETENLVWAEISSTLADLSSVWWEQPDNVREAINAFRRDLFGPKAEKIGFESAEGEDDEVRELRVTLLAAAASAEYEP
jgi:aminopeptidase 2